MEKTENYKDIALRLGKTEEILDRLAVAASHMIHASEEMVKEELAAGATHDVECMMCVTEAELKKVVEEARQYLQEGR